MNTARAAILLGALALAATLSAQAPSPQPPPSSSSSPSPSPDQPTPTFRSRVDLVQIDASVLDAERRPLRGLTAADFTILEEGQPRQIETFLEVDVPKPAAAPTAWDTQFPRDVTTNQQKVARVVVLVVDDARLGGEDMMWSVQAIRQIGKNIIDDLGPDDLAAVVYTNDNQKAQGLTNDRRRLLAAVESPPLAAGSFRRGSNDPLERGWCECGLCSFETLGAVASTLRPLPQLNKTMVYVSRGLIMSGECRRRQELARNDALRQAQLANVRVHTMDPVGLRVAGGIRPELELLKTLAETTGGRAVVQNNDPEREVTAILEESRSYYLIGFAPAAQRDGKEHRIDVRVNRRDADVRARQSYFAERPVDTRASDARKSPEDRLDDATTGLIAKSDMPLRATAAAFAGDRNEPTLAIVLDVEEAGREQPVEIVASTFDEAGKSVGSQRLKLGLSNRGADAAAAARGVEALVRLPVKPGRYEVRLGAQTADARTASVFVNADVPNFARAPLSVSGLVLSALPPVLSGPKDSFKDLMPIVPTTRRAFGAADRVTAFLRVYQAGARNPLAAALTVRIVDARGKAVLEQTSDLPAEAFTRQRRADCQFELPTRGLPSGEYVVTVDVKAGETATQRAVRFTVS